MASDEKQKMNLADANKKANKQIESAEAAKSKLLFNVEDSAKKDIKAIENDLMIKSNKKDYTADLQIQRNEKKADTDKVIVDIYDTYNTKELDMLDFLVKRVAHVGITVHKNILV